MTGCIYALVALCIVVLYKSSEVVNFATGDLVMVGAYLALLAVTAYHLPYYLVFPLVAVSVFCFGALFETVVIRRVLSRFGAAHGALVPVIIATFGLSFLLKGIVRVTPYAKEMQRLPPLIAGPPVFIGPVVLQRQDLLIVAITVLVIAGLAFFFGFTAPGRALRACSQNPKAAALVGIPVKRMRTLVWAISASLAGLAGVLVGPKLPLTPDIGVIAIIMGLSAAVIGGFSNLPGAIVGGIAIGVLQNVASLFVGSRALAIAPFLVIMVVLTLRPQGLLGGDLQAKKI